MNPSNEEPTDTGSDSFMDSQWDKKPPPPTTTPDVGSPIDLNGDSSTRATPSVGVKTESSRFSSPWCSLSEEERTEIADGQPPPPTTTPDINSPMDFKADSSSFWRTLSKEGRTEIPDGIDLPVGASADFSPHRVTLNVGGKLFTTTVDTLSSLPDTRLGLLAAGWLSTGQYPEELFYDRNPKMINSILDLYRTGELHLPRNVCGKLAARELHFWGVPEELIRECCIQGFHGCKSERRITKEMDKLITRNYEKAEEIQRMSKWKKIWLIMEQPRYNRSSKLWCIIFFAMVLLSVVLFSLETTVDFRKPHDWFLQRLASLNLTLKNATHGGQIEATQMFIASSPVVSLRNTQMFVLAFFILEFLVRLCTCPSKIYFLRKKKTWLDVFLIVQNILSLIMQHVMASGDAISDNSHGYALFFFYSLAILRVLRFFSLGKNFDTVKIMMLSTYASKKVLLFLGVALMCLAAIFGSLVFVAEIIYGNLSLSSVPLGMWFAVVTMTTVGYGDVYPKSLAGRFIGSFCAMFGIIAMALPICVITNNFRLYNDSLIPRQQMKSRVEFLKNNPKYRFCDRTKLKNELFNLEVPGQEKGTKHAMLDVSAFQPK